MMMKQRVAREEKKEKVAQITKNVIWVLHVDQASSGHFKLYAYRWLMLGPNAKQIMTANQETSAGKFKRERKKCV